MIVSRIRIGLAALAVAVALGGPAGAQEISQSHLDAALTAVQSAGAARGFDSVLPALADRVKGRLIRMRPDLHQEISATVEAVALQLTSRRADLDEAVARVWAKNFHRGRARHHCRVLQEPDRPEIRRDRSAGHPGVAQVGRSVEHPRRRGALRKIARGADQAGLRVLSAGSLPAESVR